VLDVGTPAEVVERRKLLGVEIETERAARAAELLRADAAVDEVAHYGNVLRVVTRVGEEPESVVRRLLTGELAPRSLRRVRVGVEDAFVSMVRHEDQELRNAEAS
jgi:hypothetical protein